MRGKIYGVGVGPGDPELMTLKAVRLIREAGVIAVPGREARETTAYRIASRAVPEIAGKELVPVDMPMVMDREKLRAIHREGARKLEAYAEEGKDVVFLTLGDSTVYCTFTYLQPFFEEDGFENELVPGVTSFCAAAARFNVPLVEWNEPLHILPSSHRTDAVLGEKGTCVLMKSGSHMREVKESLRKSGRDVIMAENLGMENEKLYRSVDEIPDEAGYFSLIIAKEPRKD